MSDAIWCTVVDNQIASVWIGGAGVTNAQPLVEIKPPLPTYAYYGPVLDDIGPAGATRTYPIAWPPLDDVRALATADINALVAARLGATDWYVVRAAEGYKPAPPGVLARRKATRDTGNTACLAVAAATKPEDIVAAWEDFVRAMS